VPIKFGSDGYRGIIGHSVTRNTVSAIVYGVAKFVEHSGHGGQPIPIGYDTRFLSLDFAELAARMLQDLGLRPLIAHRYCPSPYLAYATWHLKAPIGLEFTASHNPPLYGGIKLKGNHGGSLMPEQVAVVEAFANEHVETGSGLRLVDGDPTAEIFDFEREYRRAVLSAAGWEGDHDLPLLVDCMHGTGSGIYLEVLRERFNVVEALRATPDPLFGGKKPEPLPANLAKLSEAALVDLTGALGIAFDGDGDRLAVLDEGGRCLQPHEIYCLLLEHIVQTRGMPAADENGNAPVVVASVSFSGLIERVANAHGLGVREVPVGYKNVSRAMLDENAMMGGEESGGTGFGHYLPERDALLMALLLLHARRRAGTTLHDMVEDLYARYGRPVFLHRDYPLASEQARSDIHLAMPRLSEVESLAGDKVREVNAIDGIKLKTARGWLLFRLSGTEPILRIYAEAESNQQAQRYADTGARLLGVQGAAT
jgi:phosphomannomutase